jgi:hypothetical protein
MSLAFKMECSNERRFFPVDTASEPPDRDRSRRN